MAVSADWIGVELTEDDLHRVKIAAAERQANADLHDPERFGSAPEDRFAYDIAGCQAELAFYERYQRKPWVQDLLRENQRRGHDGGGFEVKGRRKAHYDLPIKARDRCRWYVLALTHDAPMIWLVGWISRKDAWNLRERVPQLHRHPWTVGQAHLHPLPERNGYTRRGAARWLVDPQTPFLCEDCGQMHPIIEHRGCR